MADIYLSRQLKLTYREIIPVLSGRGSKATITLFGRRRDDPSRLELILSRPWKPGEEINIVLVPELVAAAD